MQSRRDEPGYVGYIHHHIRPYLVADCAYALEVDHAGIGAGARNYHLGLAFHCYPFRLVIVDGLRVPVHAVGHYVEVLARNIDGRAVRKVPAVGEIHAHYGVAGREHCKEHCKVCAGARVGLHVAVLAAEELLYAAAGEVFGDIDKLTAAVVAMTGIAFGIFIGEMTARRSHYRGRDEVFAGDELYVALLAGKFELQSIGNFGVGAFD